MKVLFIAKNIPTPKFKANAIIVTIAQKVSIFSKVEFLFPNEYVPFGLQLFEKYKTIYKLKDWHSGGFAITVSKYLRLPFKGIAYLFFNKLSKSDLQFYVKKGPFDLIHAHYLLPDGYLAYLYSEKFNLPYIITIRNADMRFLEKTKRSSSDFKKANQIILKASKVLTLNYAYKLFVDDLFEINAEVIPHGIEESVFQESENENKDEVKITCVSQFDKKKNVAWVIDAVKKYNGKLPIKLNIIGSGNLEHELKEKAGNDERINFMGRLSREEVLNELKVSDIFALPSSEESFGLVYLEAAASKNAIVAYEKEGVWGVFKEEKEALYCRGKEHFNSILYHLIEDSEIRSELSEAAFLKAKELSWSKIVKAYQRVYNEVTENN